MANKLSAVALPTLDTFTRMFGLRRVIRCLVDRPSVREVADVVVLHEPTGLYLGPGMELTHREGAVPFDDIAAARRFLDRHGSEPCLTPVEAAVSSAGVRAAA